MIIEITLDFNDTSELSSENRHHCSRTALHREQVYHHPCRPQKSTQTNSLAAKDGIVAASKAGETRATGTFVNELQVGY